MEPGVWLLWATVSNSRRRRSDSGSTRLPPGLRPFPFIGNALDLRGRHLHHELARLARAYGPVMHLTMGPGNMAVVVSSTDAAKEAFTMHDRRHAARKVTDAVRALEWADRSLLWLPRAPTRGGRRSAALWPRTSSPRAASPRCAVSASTRCRTWCTITAGAPGGAVRRYAQPHIELLLLRRRCRRVGRRPQIVSGDTAAHGGNRTSHGET